MRKYEDQKLELFISLIAIIASVYHMINARWILFTLDQHKVIHTGVGLILIFLIGMKGKDLVTRIYLGLLTLITVTASGYLIFNYYAIQSRMGLANLTDTVIGIILVILVIEGARRSWGPIIPVIVILSMLYGIFGRYMPGILFHGGLSIKRLFAYAATNFQGIYGSMTGTGSMEVFMFILLGNILEACGGTEFFMKLGASVGSRFRSGPAQTAVVASGLIGTVQGSIAANVATTGTVTIPLMIKTGYKPEYAAAVEACASAGGQLMPPVMGVAAFLIATSTGTPYIRICLMALLPALVYYLYLAINIQIRAIKVKIQAGEKETGTVKAIKEDGYLLIFIPVLIWLLAIRTPVAMAAFYTTLVLIGLVTIKKIIIHKLDMNTFFIEMKEFLSRGFRNGAIEGTKIGLMLACLGVMIELFTVTGFAQRISMQMITLSRGYLPLLLFYVALTCIFFGMGMPTVGTYMAVSVLAAPALVRFGVNIVAAHLFVFYYGLMAAVTPPVGIGIIVATGIAKSNYLKTGLYATRLAIPGFLLPIFFIYRPEILFINTTITDALLAFVSALTGCVCISCLLERFYITKLKIWQSIVFITIIYLAFDSRFFSTIAGVFLFAFITFVQLAERKKGQMKGKSIIIKK